MLANEQGTKSQPVQQKATGYQNQSPYSTMNLQKQGPLWNQELDDSNNSRITKVSPNKPQNRSGIALYEDENYYENRPITNPLLAAKKQENNSGGLHFDHKNISTTPSMKRGEEIALK